MLYVYHMAFAAYVLSMGFQFRVSGCQTNLQPPSPHKGGGVKRGDQLG